MAPNQLEHNCTYCGEEQGITEGRICRECMALICSKPGCVASHAGECHRSERSSNES